jgi:ABC-2 type transport system ATP-binding protein
VTHAIHPVDGPGPVDGPVVDCRDLVVRYGDTTAVDGLSFTAGAGEVVALLGPNGAGKTSTVETLEGYRRASGGSVSVLGLDPRRDHTALVPSIGVMLQKGGVYPMLRAAGVLELFAAYYDDPEDPAELLTRVGLDGVAGTRWRNLSGGEQQRLSLALALVGRPRVVFLDEPTAGVDPEGRLAVRAVVAGLRDRGLCVLLTTHELSEAERLADRVVIIHHGRMLAVGSPGALAEGVADGAVRFTTDPGIDTVALAAEVGGRITEDQPGEYRLEPAAGTAAPRAVAELTARLADRGLSVGNLRTGRSLEEAYLSIVGAAGVTAEDAGGAVTPGGAGGRRRRRGRRGSGGDRGPSRSRAGGTP